MSVFTVCAGVALWRRDIFAHAVQTDLVVTALGVGSTLRLRLCDALTFGADHAVGAVRIFTAARRARALFTVPV